MYRYIINISFLSLIISNFVIAQETLIIGPESSAANIMRRNSLLKTEINYEEQKLGSTIETNVHIHPYLLQNNGSTNYDGSIIKTGSTFIQNGDSFKRITTLIDAYFYKMQICLSLKGNWIYYTDHNVDNEQKTMNFLGLASNKQSFVFGYDKNDRKFVFNSDFSIFAFQDGDNYNIYGVERDGSNFDVHLILDSEWFNSLNLGHYTNINAYLRPNLSFMGDRLYFASYIEEENTKRHFYVDRTIGGWSEPKEIVLNDTEGNELHFEIINTANNGRTLLIKIYEKQVKFPQVEEIAIIQEENGSWGLPQYLEYEPQHKEGRRSDEFQISQNGKVIAVQSLKKIIADVNYFYDAIIFIQTPERDWVKYQVNDPNLDIGGDILLSGDGTILYWIGHEPYSSIPFSRY